MKKTKRATTKFAIVLGWIIVGLLLNHFKIGTNAFGIFGSLGTYFIYIGFVGMFVAGFTEVLRKDRAADERMQYVATKAMKLTFLVFVAVAFVIMVIDGINPITMPYHLFMSYLVSGILAVYYISYKILLRRY